jgi:hypothetical protein
MALKHILKNTDYEIIFKCYTTSAEGGSIDISVQNDCTKSASQAYVAPTSVPNETGGGFFDYTGSRVMITGIWWGLKNNKQLDLTRIIDPAVPTLHNHYYFVGAGYHDFGGADFSDRVYANKDIRVIFDGPGHCIIRLRKEGWASKLEEAQFGAYDNPNAVGS